MDEVRLTIWVVRLLVGLFASLMVFDVLDDALLGNHYGGVPTALSGIVGAIVAGLFGHDFFRRGNGKKKE